MSTEAEPTETLGAARGQIAAWGALAAVNAVFIVTTIPLPAGGAEVRALHHAYDAAQLLAFGLLSASLASAWDRWGPKHRAAPWLALSLASIAVGAVVLPVDLNGAAEKAPLPIGVALAALVGCVALVVPVVALAATSLAGFRRTGRWGAVALFPLGLAAGIANDVVLPNDYPGIHFYLAWLAAIVMGAALATAPVPFARASGRRLTAARRLGFALVVTLAGASLVVWPGSTVMLELFKIDGAVVAPIVVRARSTDEGSAVIEGPDRAWFRDRTSAPEVPASSPPVLPKNAIVVLFIVDCMRADVLVGEKHRAKLPHFLALRDRSLHFTDARSVATATTQSVTSIFTSRYYSQLFWEYSTVGKDPRVYPNKDTSTRFPEVLQKASVPTVVVTGLSGLVNKYGVVGGFDEEDVQSMNMRAPELVQRVADRVVEAGDGPLFLYVHVADAHAPYDRAGKAGTELDRYIGELGIVDQGLGRLMRTIDERGLAGRTSIIVTADHGEAFGEHNDTTHAHTLYDELLRVPMIISGPAVTPRVIDEPVSGIDIGPTVLDLFGQPTPGSFMGQSLAGFLRGASPSLDRPIAAESARRMQVMVFDDGTKVIRDITRGTVEIYDLNRDPGELANLYHEGPGASEPHLDLLRAFFHAHMLRRPGYAVPYQKW